LGWSARTAGPDVAHKSLDRLDLTSARQLIKPVEQRHNVPVLDEQPHNIWHDQLRILPGKRDLEERPAPFTIISHQLVVTPASTLITQTT
jgi:hypothetical protein